MNSDEELDTGLGSNEDPDNVASDYYDIQIN